MPSIYDNLSAESKLGPALRVSFMSFDTLDVATGYLDLRGWSELADLVDAKLTTGSQPVARLLVGMVAPSDTQQLLESLQEQVQPPAFGADEHDNSKAIARRDQLVRHLRNQLMRGLATTEGRATLQTLKKQLQDGSVKMKVFTRAPLHGKTYIFHQPSNAHTPMWSYVGSSNLTGAGLGRNLELNIDVPDADANKKLSDWFNDRWDDPFSREITTEIIELIEESWADETQRTPFEIYLKVCHSLSQDARDGMGYVLPASMRDLLLDYQQSAVRTLARRIVRRGGTMLGDVVGLGKTLTAVATALMLEAAEDYTTLILCPKNLEEMWNEHLEEYEITGRVVPYSMAHKVLPSLKRYNLIICDESHNLRNSGTIARDAIVDYVRDNDSKVLLLTATPYNLAFEDVANQLGLYIGEDDDLGIVPSAAMAVDPTLVAKVDGKVSTLTAFRRSEEAEDWKRLMSDHLVRRTRSFIKRTAKKETIKLANGKSVEREFLQFANGEKFFFPERVARPLSHDFQPDDPAKLMESDATLDAVKGLLLPRYRLSEYDNPKAEHTKADVKAIEDIRSGRGNVSGFVRIGLFKRLSSSGHSFIISLQRQRARNELFVYAIDNDLPIPLGTFSDKQVAISDEDAESEAATHGTMESRYEELRSGLPKSTKWISSGIFTPQLRKDLQSDSETISKLLDSFGSWDATKDSKINALVDLLRNDHPDEKVLIFTEYGDTASYVSAALADAGVANVGLATGDSENLGRIARRFSPHSNKLPSEKSKPDVEPDDPIDVLVATDVLSEGQNLQDAHIVVNYDLPWAIIRIIQRAGRVDRVGQKSDTVYIYLLTHEKIETQIKVRQRIKARLGASAAAFGSDEQFFGGKGEVRVLEDFYNGRVPDDIDDQEGEADSVSEAWLAWTNAQDSHPGVVAKVLGMQDLVHSTRTKYVGERRSGVACFASSESGIDLFGFAPDSNQKPIASQLLTPLEALRLFEAHPETPTVDLRSDHFDREAQLVHGPLTTEVLASGNLKGIRKWVWQRLGGDKLHAPELVEALGALHDRPLTERATTRLTQARRSKYSLQDLGDLVVQLHAEEQLVIGGAQSDAIRVICSLGVS